MPDTLKATSTCVICISPESLKTLSAFLYKYLYPAKNPIANTAITISKIITFFIIHLNIKYIIITKYYIFQPLL